MGIFAICLIYNTMSETGEGTPHENLEQQSLTTLTPDRINQFYDDLVRLPRKGRKDPQKEQEEIRLIEEAFQSPENTRTVFERKLGQLADHLGYKSVADMEAALPIERLWTDPELVKRHDQDTVKRLRDRFSEDDRVFVHNVLIERQIEEDGPWNLYNSYLLWARGQDGKLKEVRSQYGWLGGWGAEIKESGVTAGRYIDAHAGEPGYFKPDVMKMFPNLPPNYTGQYTKDFFDEHIERSTTFGHRVNNLMRRFINKQRSS
jgi:hypothetical protein